MYKLPSFHSRCQRSPKARFLLFYVNIILGIDPDRTDDDFSTSFLASLSGILDFRRWNQQLAWKPFEEDLHKYGCGAAGKSRNLLHDCLMQNSVDSFLFFNKAPRFNIFKASLRIRQFPIALQVKTKEIHVNREKLFKLCILEEFFLIHTQH